MSKWKKGETKFSVSVSDDGHGSNLCRIPKPIIKKLKNPKKIMFIISDKKIIVDRDCSKL